jgi:hypothetical protein
VEESTLSWAFPGLDIFWVPQTCSFPLKGSNETSITKNRSKRFFTISVLAITTSELLDLGGVLESLGSGGENSSISSEFTNEDILVGFAVAEALMVFPFMGSEGIGFVDGLTPLVGARVCGRGGWGMAGGDCICCPGGDVMCSVDWWLLAWDIVIVGTDWVGACVFNWVIGVETLVKSVFTCDFGGVFGRARDKRPFLALGVQERSLTVESEVRSITSVSSTEGGGGLLVCRLDDLVFMAGDVNVVESAFVLLLGLLAVLLFVCAFLVGLIIACLEGLLEIFVCFCGVLVLGGVLEGGVLEVGLLGVGL